jgi:hypothetical protein
MGEFLLLIAVRLQGFYTGETAYGQKKLHNVDTTRFLNKCFFVAKECKKISTERREQYPAFVK